MLATRVWMSHLTAKELKIGCSTLFDMRGITFADEMASTASKGVEVLPNQANAVQAIDGMAWQFRKRIIDAKLAAFSAQPKREFLPPRKRVRARRRRTGSLPKWKQESTTCTAMLAQHEDQRV